jgi:hypothetical protein
MSIRLFSLILICSILVVSPPYVASNVPEFLEVGSFARYRQEFSTGETHELYWEILSLDSDSIEIELHSHGLVYNATSESFTIIVGGGMLVANRTTLSIIQAFHLNGTEIEGHPVGEKIAFWIPAGTTESTPINSMYETNVYPKLVGPLQFDCLHTSRMCWMTENFYSMGNQMNRYYDQETGIVLMIETNRTVSSSEISVLETLNETNILRLIANTGFISVETTILTGVIIGTIMIVLTIYHNRKK